MATQAATDERRVMLLFGLAALLHVIGDPVTTWLAYQNGGHELNPLLRPALDSGLAAYVIIHIPLVLVTLAGGYGLLYFLRRMTPHRRKWAARVCEAGFTAAAVWGSVLVLNNLSLAL